MPGVLMAAVRFMPDLLHTNEKSADIVNHPCPRTLSYAGKLLNAGINDLESIAGALGEGYAYKLLGFIKTYDSLPDLDLIIKQPMDGAIPSNPATLYAVVSALVSKTTASNADNIIRYGERLPTEFSVLLVKDMVRKDSAVACTEGCKKWAIKNQNILF
jgi:hypothetical protein